MQTRVLGEFQAQKQAEVFLSVPAPMQGKLLLVQVLLCSILSPHMHYALSAVIHENFLFFIVSLSHHHLSPIASSLPGYWRMFWSLKHSPQILL